MCVALGQWTLEDKKYIAYWQRFLSRDIQTRYYIEHETFYKYTCTTNRTTSRRCIAFQKIKSQFPNSPLAPKYAESDWKAATQKYMDRRNHTGFSYRAIYIYSGIIIRRGYIGFTTKHILYANKTLTQMAGYTSHFQWQVRHPILWFYIQEG